MKSKAGVWDIEIKSEHSNATYFVKLLSSITGPRNTIEIPDVGK